MHDIVDKLKQTEWWHADCDVRMEAAKEIEQLRTMIKDFLEGWDWYQQDPYDREGPWDEVYAMKTYIEKIRKTKDDQ